MLNGIKEIINKKREFLEAASIIFDDTNNELDDLIVLEENDSEELEELNEGFLFKKNKDKRFKDAKFSDLSSELRTTLKAVSKLIITTAKELFKEQRYDKLSSSKWAKESLSKFTKGPSSNGEVGMVRATASGVCMIQITGHFKNEGKSPEEKLMHKFIDEVFKKVRVAALKEHDIRLSYEGSSKSFEGFDAYPSTKIGKEVYNSIDESKETDVKKPKELKESFYIIEEDLSDELEEAANEDSDSDSEKDDKEEIKEEAAEDILDDQIESSSDEDKEESEESEESDDSLLDEPLEDKEDEVAPSTEDEDDLLSVSVDLKTNTITDVLPVPPDNASEALPGEDNDILNSRVDSGFESDEEAPTEPELEESDELLDEPIEESDEETDTKEIDESSELLNVPLAKEGEEALPPKPSNNSKENLNKVNEASLEKHTKDLEKQNKSKNSVVKESVDDFLMEDISLGGDAPPAEGSTTDAPPDTAAAGTTPEENAVTSAVRDKVGEAEEPVADDAGLSSDGDAIAPASKDELMKKLSNITKSLEDAKLAITKSI